MSELDSIIQITITRQTTAVATTSFSIPLILADFTNFSERTRIYNSLNAVGADFPSTSNVYLMASREFGQELSKPPSIVVGRRQIDGVVGTVPFATVGQVYTVTINGTNYSYTATSGNTAAIIVAGIKTAYDLAPKVGITFTDNTDGTFSVEVGTLGTAWSIKSGSNIILTNDTPTETLTEALEAITLSNNSWYAVNAEVHTEDEQLEIATFIEALPKIYLTSSNDNSHIATTYDLDNLTDIGSIFKANGFTRSSVTYLPTADTQFPEAAWTGAILPRVAGSVSWNFKRATGVTPVNLSDTSRANLRSKNTNMFTEVAGVNIFQDGVMADGRPISEITISDWIKARMQEQIYFRLINLLKIPFTRDGFATIELEMRSVLAQAEANGAIDSGWTVTSPDPLAIPENQRAQGIAGVFKFSARLAGEVKTIVIEGTLTI